MGAVSMIMGKPLAEDVPQVFLAEDDEVIQHLLTCTGHPAFAKGIHLGTSWRDRPEFYAVRFEDRTELLGELAVTISDDVSRLVLIRLFGEEQAHVAGLLGHPRAVGVGRHAGDVHAASVNMQEEQDVVGNRPPKRPHLGREKIGRPQRLDVPLDEVVPGPVPTLRAGVDPFSIRIRATVAREMLRIRNFLNSPRMRRYPQPVPSAMRMISSRSLPAFGDDPATPADNQARTGNARRPTRRKGTARRKLWRLALDEAASPRRGAAATVDKGVLRTR